MTQRRYVLCLALIVLAALALQLGLFSAGLYRITSDESARILTAWDLSWSNALEPFLWPPFYKLFVGGAMKLFPSIFFTPRVLVEITGLLCLLSLAWLATELFGDRRIALITAILALLAPQRLVFSVAPLSDIYYFTMVIAAAAATARWLRTGRAAPLLLGCGFLLLAETVRFESGLFAVFFEMLLLYRGLVARTLPLPTLVAASLILFAFPPLWALNSLVWYGTLRNLSVAAQQFTGEFGRNSFYAIKWSPLRFFVQDMLWNPLTFAGLLAVAWLSLRERAIRVWTLLFGVPLVVFSLVCIITFSIPTAATWRTSGVWTLMMTPFDALIALRIGQFLWSAGGAARIAAPILLVLAILPMGVRSAWYARDGMHNNSTHHLHQERALDTWLDKRLAADPGAVAVIDSSTNLDYLDVLAFSRFPSRLIPTGSGDPVRIGFYEPMRAAYEGDPKVQGFLTDRFGLDHGGAEAALRAHHVRYLVVRNPDYLAALDLSALVTRLHRFNDWTIYGVRPVPPPSGARSGTASRALTRVPRAG